MAASPVNVLFELSAPSSSRSDDSLQKLPRRDYLLTVRHEDTQDDLRFERVDALRITYHQACTLDMTSCYDRVTDVGKTSWLREVLKQLLTAGEPCVEIRHIKLYLDDGPCYEFICRGFTGTTTERS